MGTVPPEVDVAVTFIVLETLLSLGAAEKVVVRSVVVSELVTEATVVAVVGSVDETTADVPPKSGATSSLALKAKSATIEAVLVDVPAGAKSQAVELLMEGVTSEPLVVIVATGASVLVAVVAVAVVVVVVVTTGMPVFATVALVVVTVVVALIVVVAEAVVVVAVVVAVALAIIAVALMLSAEVVITLGVEVVVDNVVK